MTTENTDIPKLEADTINEQIGPSDFGIWLKSARLKKKWSPEELAEEARITKAQIYNIEAGRSRNPQKVTVDKLTKALGARPDAKITNDEPTGQP